MKLERGRPNWRDQRFRDQWEHSKCLAVIQFARAGMLPAVIAEKLRLEEKVVVEILRGKFVRRRERKQC